MGDLGIRRCIIGGEGALSLAGSATFLETFAGLLGGGAIIDHCRRAHAAEPYRQRLADPAQACWLVEAAPDAAPVGILLVGPPDLPVAIDATDLELKRIYLLSKFQGGGIGKAMAMIAIAHARARHARRLLLGVYAGNAQAIGFYWRLGFEQVGTRQFNVGGVYYDECILARPIEAA